MGRLARRGALAGLLAGIVAAGYGLVFVEPSIQRSIDLESARRAATGQDATELLTRAQQHVGLVVGLALAGAALGVLYGLVFALVHRAREALASWPPATVWAEAVRLAAVGFASTQVLPLLRYPANPPGVGGTSTIGVRTNAWLLALGFALFATALAWRLGALLVERRVAQPWPSLAVAALLAAGLGVMFLLLPDTTDPVEIPAVLLWRFRVTSFGSYLLLWGGLAVFFTLLTARERARAQAHRARVSI